VRAQVTKGDGDELKVGKARMVEEIAATNGYIIVVDAVLLPDG